MSEPIDESEMVDTSPTGHVLASDTPALAGSVHFRDDDDELLSTDEMWFADG